VSDTQFNPLGIVTAPADWVLPASLQILLKTCFAHFDGTGAAGAYLPTLQILSDSGHTVVEIPQDASVASGSSVEATWAPFLGKGGTTIKTGAGIPPFPALDDYVFKHTNTVVTGVGFNSQANLIIQGNPVVLDGATRVKIEFFAPVAEVQNGPNNQAIGFELWDGATNKGTIAYVEGNFNPTLTDQIGGPAYGVIIDTPAAGTHTYAIYAFTNVAGGTCTVYGNTFVDGTGNLGPCWYRVTTT
jgi:hypothetical protein